PAIEGAADDRAVARHAHQALTGFVFCGLGFDFAFVPSELLLQRDEQLILSAQQFPQATWLAVMRIFQLCGDRLPEAVLNLSQIHTVLCEQRSSPLAQPLLFSHQRSAQMMQALVQLLIDRLDLHATNTAMLNRLSNGKRVVVIVLLATQVGFDMLCWQQLHTMTQRAYLPGPVVRAGASLHANDSPRMIGQK